MGGGRSVQAVRPPVVHTKTGATARTVTLSSPPAIGSGLHDDVSLSIAILSVPWSGVRILRAEESQIGGDRLERRTADRRLAGGCAPALPRRRSRSDRATGQVRRLRGSTLRLRARRERREAGPPPRHAGRRPVRHSQGQNRETSSRLRRSSTQSFFHDAATDPEERRPDPLRGLTSSVARGSDAVDLVAGHRAPTGGPSTQPFRRPRAAVVQVEIGLRCRATVVDPPRPSHVTAPTAGARRPGRRTRARSRRSRRRRLSRG